MQLIAVLLTVPGHGTFAFDALVSVREMVEDPDSAVLYVAVNVGWLALTVPLLSAGDVVDSH